MTRDGIPARVEGPDPNGGGLEGPVDAEAGRGKRHLGKTSSCRALWSTLQGCRWHDIGGYGGDCYARSLAGPSVPRGTQHSCNRTFFHDLVNVCLPRHTGGSTGTTDCPDAAPGRVPGTCCLLEEGWLARCRGHRAQLRESHDALW